MHIYGAYNIWMNMYSAPNTCMNIDGAFICNASHTAFIVYGIHFSIGWISTLALRQELGIKQPSIAAYD